MEYDLMLKVMRGQWRFEGWMDDEAGVAGSLE